MGYKIRTWDNRYGIKGRAIGIMLGDTLKTTKIQTPLPYPKRKKNLSNLSACYLTSLVAKKTLSPFVFCHYWPRIMARR